MVKKGKKYQLTFWVSVKHGLVKFRPVSMQLGPIISHGFAQKGNKDVWTYTIELNSVKDLKKETRGKLHLSVPIANIHNRIFGVYFKFGVKNIAHQSSLPAIKDANSSSASKTADSASSSSINSAPAATNAHQSTPSTSTSSEKQAPVKATEAETPAVTSADLAKYQVKPQTKSYADIALVNYPILQAVLIFLLVDGMIVGVAIYLYKKERRN